MQFSSSFSFRVIYCSLQCVGRKPLRVVAHIVVKWDGLKPVAYKNRNFLVTLFMKHNHIIKLCHLFKLKDEVNNHNIN